MIFTYILMYFDSVIALSLLPYFYVFFFVVVSFWRKSINFSEMYYLYTVFDNSSHICPKTFCFKIELFS